MKEGSREITGSVNEGEKESKAQMGCREMKRGSEGEGGELGWKERG